MRITDESNAFFHRLLETPSPSGFEERIQQVVRDFAKPFADEVRTDLHGNVIAVKNPEGSPRIMLDGHCDQIGLIVAHFDDNGFIYAQAIGGWDPQILLGQKVTVWAKSGPILGVIARKPKHLLTAEEMKKVPEIHELWIDLGLKDKDEAKSLVSAGDPVTVVLGPHEMKNGLVCGPKMDDATGLFVVFEALKRIAGQHVNPAVYVVSAVQEEIGLRGAHTAAYGVDPQVGIAVDVTHATDCPTIDKRTLGDIRIGNGPVVFRGPNVNARVAAKLAKVADEERLPVQFAGLGRAMSNDANPIQLNRAGVATAAIGLPLRYMHSPVEVVALSDLDHAAELLAKFLVAVEPGEDFTPRLD
jgi:putative aminopeptidase FrvX